MLIWVSHWHHQKGFPEKMNRLIFFIQCVLVPYTIQQEFCSPLPARLGASLWQWYQSTRWPHRADVAHVSACQNHWLRWAVTTGAAVAVSTGLACASTTTYRKSSLTGWSGGQNKHPCGTAHKKNVIPHAVLLRHTVAVAFLYSDVDIACYQILGSLL